MVVTHPRRVVAVDKQGQRVGRVGPLDARIGPSATNSKLTSVVSVARGRVNW
jgi:hypothetical protein